MKKRTFVMLATALLFGASVSWGQSAAPQPSNLSQHATVKVAKFSLSAVKKTVGVVLFAAEPAIDAVHLGFHGASAATNIGSDPDSALKVFRVVHDVFAGGDFIFGKADSYDEKAESFFFGSSN